MPVHSAGILLYRKRGAGVEVFLVHPGGPYWARKDAGAWSIPKGLVDSTEDGLAAARRELQEETGLIPDGAFEPLGSFRLPGGKRLSVWALESDCDPAALKSNTFSMEWPPKSGQLQSFPEVDRGAWFGHAQALTQVSKGQAKILDEFFAHHKAS